MVTHNTPTVLLIIMISITIEPGAGPATVTVGCKNVHLSPFLHPLGRLKNLHTLVFTLFRNVEGECR